MENGVFLLAADSAGTYITLVPLCLAMIHHNPYLSDYSANNGPLKANQFQGQTLSSKTHVISMSTDKIISNFSPAGSII